MALQSLQYASSTLPVFTHKSSMKNKHPETDTGAKAESEKQSCTPLERPFTPTNVQNKGAILRLRRLHCVSTKPQTPTLSVFLSLPLYTPLYSSHTAPVSTFLLLGLKVCGSQTLGLKV